MTAAAEVFPGADVSIEHSASTVGGYFCEVSGRAPFTQPELGRSRRGCGRSSRPTSPSCARVVPLAEAAALFAARGEHETVTASGAPAEGHARALRACAAGRTTSRATWCRRPAACEHFALHAFPPGFLLQFPHQGRPTELSAITPYPKLFEVFEEAGHWLDRLGIRSAGALNDAIAAGRLPEVSLVAEALHEARIAQIAADIVAQGDRVKLVLIAGPSSSGKTTFSKRLAVQLLANGRRPFPVGLDDYFVDRDRTPRDARGQLRLRVPGGRRRGAVQRAPAEPDGRPHARRCRSYVFKTGRRGAGRHRHAPPRPHHHRRGHPRAEPGAGAGRCPATASTGSTCRRSRSSTSTATTASAPPTAG